MESTEGDQVTYHLDVEVRKLYVGEDYVIKCSMKPTNQSTLQCYKFHQWKERIDFDYLLFQKPFFHQQKAFEWLEIFLTEQ